MQLVLSQLRTTSHLVKAAGECFLQPLLPALLAGLKFYMATGLPGQPDVVVPLPAAASECVELFHNALHCECCFVVAIVTKPKKERCSGTRAVSRSSHWQQRPQQSRPSKPPSAPTTSDSEVSDSEPQDSAISKALACKLRHQALVCLASVFSVSLFATSFRDKHISLFAAGCWSS